MTLLAAILNLLPDKDQSSIRKKALPALKFALKVAGKAGVAWLLKTNTETLGKELEEAGKDIGDAVVDKAVEAMLTEHMEAEKSLLMLREALEEIANEKPLVLFVDELDRCRPDFAVRMLEIIKHVFDVEGVKFVLVTNTRQLMAAIRHCYGSEIDAQRYLDKFVGFCFRLPAQFKVGGKEEGFIAAQEHFKNIVRGSSVLGGDNILIGNKDAISILNELIKFQQPSLREVEALARHFEVAYMICEGRYFSSNLQVCLVPLVVYTVYCHCFHPGLADEIVRGEFDPIHIGESIGITRIHQSAEYIERTSLIGLAGLMILDLPTGGLELGVPGSIAVYNEHILQIYQAKQYFSGHSLRIEVVRNIMRIFQFGCNG